MKKLLKLLLSGSLLIANLSLHARTTGVSRIIKNSKRLAANLPEHGKNAAHHLFSSDGAKDLIAAYGVAMAVTLIHELGHAAVAKLLCGAPVDIVIGGPRSKDARLKIGGVQFAGFNPLESNSRWEEHYKEDGSIYHPTLAQDTAVLVVGPLMQAVAGYCIYKCLQTKDKFYIAKAAALGAIADTIIGINGMYGARYIPWSDSSKLVENIKKYFKK